MNKTNAIRILEAANITHAVHEYDVSDGKIDGVSVAAKCSRSPDMVFKTLVTTGKVTGFKSRSEMVKMEGVLSQKFE